jgi:hypothetical protein
MNTLLPIVTLVRISRTHAHTVQMLIRVVNSVSRKVISIELNHLQENNPVPLPSMPWSNETTTGRIPVTSDDCGLTQYALRDIFFVFLVLCIL